MMTESKDIVVEVIVWDGIFKPFNPAGHVTTKIQKSGLTYSYSLEDEDDPKLTCNSESFKKLLKHEEGMRDGFGFVLNLNENQAKAVFISMQTRFNSYNKPSCQYHILSHNCTYAIQMALKKSGVNLHTDVSFISKLQVNKNQTILPAYVEECLLKTKNNNGYLVKNIIRYKKGEQTGELVEGNKVDLVFHLEAVRSDSGWYTNHESWKTKII